MLSPWIGSPTRLCCESRWLSAQTNPSTTGRLLDEIKTGDAGVVVTARVEGPDLVIRTLEWMGDESQLVSPLEDLAVFSLSQPSPADSVEE